MLQDHFPKLMSHEPVPASHMICSSLEVLTWTDLQRCGEEFVPVVRFPHISMAISGTDWLEVPTIYIYKAYVREYPHKIWPYMVQYLHFRILDFPVNIAGVISLKMVCSIYWLHRIPLRIHWWLIVSDCNGYCGTYPIVKPKFPVSGCDLMTVDV
jgi:hypothetical protein